MPIRKTLTKQQAAKLIKMIKATESGKAPTDKGMSRRNEVNKQKRQIQHANKLPKVSARTLANIGQQLRQPPTDKAFAQFSQMQSQLLQQKSQQEFLEAQRRYIEEQRTRQHTELEALKTQIQTQLQAQLQSYQMNPPPGYVHIRRPTGEIDIAPEDDIPQKQLFDQYRRELLDAKEELELADEDLYHAKTDKERVDKLLKEQQAPLPQQIVDEQTNVGAKISALRNYRFRTNTEAIIKAIEDGDDPVKDKVFILRLAYNIPRDQITPNDILEQAQLPFVNILSLLENHVPDFYETYVKTVANSAPLTKQSLKDQKTVNKKYNVIMNKIAREVKKIRRGSGGTKFPTSDALYDSEIDQILEPLRKRGYLGTYMADELPNIRDNELQLVGSFIMNTDPATNPKTGEPMPGTHWVAVYWDMRHPYHKDPMARYDVGEIGVPQPNRGLYYFDPFGRPPSEQFMVDIRKLMDRVRKKFGIDYETYFSYNPYQYQDVRSSKCGYFCMQWLVDMIDENPDPFPQYVDCKDKNGPLSVNESEPKKVCADRIAISEKKVDEGTFG